MQRKKGAVDLQGLLKPARPLSAEDALEVPRAQRGDTAKAVAGRD